MPLQRWVPGLQMKSQLVPLQVGVALKGAVQGVHEVPHDDGLVFDAQFVPQRWKPVLHA